MTTNVIDLQNLLSGVTVTATGATTQTFEQGNGRTYQAIVEGTGAVSATVLIEVSNTGNHWILMSTFSLTGTTSATDGFTSSAPWAFVRARLTAISGTGAAVTVVMGA